MSKAEFCSLTWTELREAFKRNPVILIPMGSVEQHGPQTPVGDYRYTTEICRVVAERTGAISCPTIPWGYSEHFRPFPGTLTVRSETLKLILEDHLDCLLPFGLDHIMFVCGHKGDLPILEEVARKAKLERKIRIATMEPLAWFTEDWKREVYGLDKPWTGHGSDPMQSLGMHLFPDDVRLDLMETGHKPVWNGQTFQGTATTFTEGAQWHMYLDYNDLAPNGVIGDPKLASAEVGRRTFDRLCDLGCKIVKRFAEIDTRIREG